MKYVYSGPITGVTLKEPGANGEATKREVALFPGKTVDLPESHPYVKTLVKLKHLTPAPAPKASSTKLEAFPIKEASK